MNGRVVVAALLISCIACDAPGTQRQSGEKEEKRNEKHGWLGVVIQDVTARLAREKELSVKSGALVNDVTGESPAAKAGIRDNDVIVDFNGRSIEDSDDLLTAVRGASPGEEASVTLYRGKEKKIFQVTLGTVPRRDFAFSFHGPGRFSVPGIPPIPRIGMFRTEGMLGLTLCDLNSQLGEYFEAPDGKGVLVQEVDRKSAGDSGGFKAGDVIIRAGKEDVRTTEDIRDAIGGFKKGDKVEFGIVRKGERLTLTVESEGSEGERWDRFHSYEFYNDAPGRIERNTLKREMEKLKEELRSLGTRIGIEMQELKRKLKSITG